MKRLIVLALAVSMMLGGAAFAQYDSLQGLAPTDKDAATPVKNIKGTVKADGDKLSFVADKGMKSWGVMNPETLKGHEGHHVELSAHVFANRNAIHVMNVKMLKPAK